MIPLYVLMHSGQKCDSCVLMRVNIVLICLRASDKSRKVQVEVWSIGQAITPMQNMECREDYSIWTPNLEKLGNEDLVQVPCNHGVTSQKYLNMDD